MVGVYRPCHRAMVRSLEIYKLPRIPQTGMSTDDPDAVDNVHSSFHNMNGSIPYSGIEYYRIQ